MHIILTGGTGFIGSRLIPLLTAAGHTVTAFSRSGRAPKTEGVTWERWTPTTAGPWQDHIDGADAVVHLAGKGIFDSRWSDEVKRELRDSRIISTDLIVEAIAKATSRPSVLVCGSAVGYYGNTDTPTDEGAPAGDDFLATLCVDWEAAANAATTHGARVINLRTGIVLGQQGALEQMALPFKMFVGGPVGSGEQFMSWIHVRDLTRMILFAIDDDAVTGPINGAAPHPKTMGDFSTLLGKVLSRPSFFKVPSFALKIAAGDAAEVLLGGQYAIPKAALEAGFTFEFDDLERALRDILIDGNG